MEALDHMVAAIGAAPHRAPPAGAPAAITDSPQLMSLVERVQRAVSTDRSDSILEGHVARARGSGARTHPQTPDTHTHTHTPHNTQNVSPAPEMSVATYKYLCKYNLLASSSPPAASPSARRALAALPSSRHDTRILDHEGIKRLPKL